MGLRFDPVGGGQLKQALKQIIEAERAPIQQMEVRKAREDARLKLFQEFKGKFSAVDRSLAEFTNFKKFRELKADLGDGSNLMSVTLDKDVAEPGSYTIQIDQLAKRTSIMTNGFSDPNENVLGIGYVVAYDSKGETREVFIDEDNASPNGVASLINREQDLPFRASVVRDASDPERPWRLIFSAKNDGADGGLSFPDFYFLDGYEDLYIDSENDAQNAVIQLDGFPVEAEGNNVPNFLKGVNVQLKAARPDQPFTLNITEDHQKISGKVKGLVDQVNGILEFITKQNTVDEKSDTRTTFTGDTSLQNIEFRLRNLLHEGFPVGNPEAENFRFVFLSEMGMEFTKSGQVQFKEDKFTKLLQEDFDGMAQALTGTYGFANQLREVVAGYTRVGDGLLATREQGLRNRIKTIDNQITDKQRRLEQRERSLTEQFSRLQASLGALQRQQQYLSAALPGAGGGNPVAALLGG